VNEEKPKPNEIVLALRLGILLSDIRETRTLKDLQFMNQTLQRLKKMPKFAPSPKRLKLSEITPKIKREETVEEEQTEKSEGWFAPIRRRLRRRLGFG